MVDTIQKVRPGQPLRIPATAYNAFVDAAVAHKDQQDLTGRDPLRGARQAGIVSVKNTTAGTVPRLGVLGIDGPLFTPTANLNEFKSRVLISGVAPTVADHTSSFVITLEPIAAGKIGRAYAAGVCPVQVNITDEVHQFADVNGSTANLESYGRGDAKILWREAATGTVWTLVRLGAGGADTDEMNLKEIGSTGETETADTDTWDITDVQGKEGVKITRLYRMAYDDAGDQKLYAYYRDEVWPLHLAPISISAETRVEIDGPEDCP